MKFGNRPLIVFFIIVVAPNLELDIWGKFTIGVFLCQRPIRLYRFLFLTEIFVSGCNPVLCIVRPLTFGVVLENLFIGGNCFRIILKVQKTFRNIVLCFWPEIDGFFGTCLANRVGILVNHPLILTNRLCILALFEVGIGDTEKWLLGPAAIRGVP